MNSIFHRVSIRKYKSQPVEPDKIEQMRLAWGLLRVFGCQMAADFLPFCPCSLMGIPKPLQEFCILLRALLSQIGRSTFRLSVHRA